MIDYLDYTSLDDVRTSLKKGWLYRKRVQNVETISDPDNQPYNMYRVWYWESDETE
jgi:hypothetical protein